MTYRVVHWGTGNAGRLALRGIINNPDLELVGLYAYSPEKVGKDAGELCDLGPAVGVPNLGAPDARRLIIRRGDHKLAVRTE